MGDILRKQLAEWLSVNLDPDIPSHILLFVQPSAVSAKEFVNYLSQEERDKILGLEKFRDSMQVAWMRSMTEKAETRSASAELSKTIPLEEIKQHIEEEEKELDACKTQFDDLRNALPDNAEAELLALYDRLAVSSVVLDSTGRPGVKIPLLDQEVAKYFSDRFTEFGCSPQRVVDSFHDFDIDKSGVVSRKEFEAFLKRIRAA